VTVLAFGDPAAFSSAEKERLYAEEESQTDYLSLPGPGPSDQLKGNVRQTSRRNNMLGGCSLFGTAAGGNIRTAFAP
jgi:hypothetical protein